MAAKFRKVDPRAWTDERFRKLKSEEKLLALWMLTSVRVNRCGIVLWSPGLASEETGIPASRIDTVCHTVCHTLNWIHDTVSNTVFLARWWRYNRPDNPKALAGALSDLHDLPENGLKSSLVVAANDLPIGMREMYLSHLDTIYHTVSHTVSSQEQEKEKEQEQEQEEDSSEPAKTPPSEPTTPWVFPVNGNPVVPEWSLPLKLYHVLLESYPAVNLDEELRKARAWCEANPKSRKTAGGMSRFLNSWMSRIQNSGHSCHVATKPAPRVTPSTDEVKRSIQEEFGHVKHPLFRDDPEPVGQEAPF